MIISASRRTDIPAFYGQWFWNRLQDGVFCVRNPMNHSQIHQVQISPDTVDCFVFWTKNPRPFLPYIHRIAQLGYTFYFQFTLNAYGQELEPQLLAESMLIETFQELSASLGKQRVLWRYDPIIHSPDYDHMYHEETFHRLAEELHPYTDLCTFSFLDLYAKTKRNLQGLQVSDPPPEQRRRLALRLQQLAQQCGIPLVSCCGSEELADIGIPAAACIDKERIEALQRRTLQLKRDRNQRVNCGCAASIDMGAYNTCHHGCRYCYANASPKSVAANAAKHDPRSQLLLGTLEAGETVIVRR